MSNAWTTIIIALIGVMGAGVTAAFAFLGKNRENKASFQDQFTDNLMADRQFWREESANIRSQLEARILQVATLQAELDATKEALVHQSRQQITVVQDE